MSHVPLVDLRIQYQHLKLMCLTACIFSSYGYRRGMLPATEALAGYILSLPIYLELTAVQRGFVVSALKK